MKHLLYRSFIVSVFLAGSFTAMAQDILSYVDPEIGTAHSRWFFYTPAAVPEGMAKLAPSTNGHYGNASGWEAVGYDTRQNSIEGFVHFHEWQVGGVCFMPTVGPLRTTPGDLDKPHSGYRSAFERKNQVAQPGYYKVLLDDYRVTAELTATKRVGFHRYTFPASDQSHIIMDMGSVQGESGPVTDAGIHMVDAIHFEGYVITDPKYVQRYDPGGKVCMYIFGELTRRPDSVGSFATGLYLNYKTSANERIGIKVGLSYTSIANARANLLAEAAHLSFDEARARAQEEWRRELGRITIADTSRTNKIKFYTGLYHALLGRGVASDVNGDYPKHGGAVGRLASTRYNFINTDAIWGAFWDLTQLWSLSYPSFYEDFVHTQLQIYKDKGWFGDGIANSEYVSGVGTNFVGLAIAAAYQAGIRDYDVEQAWQAVKKNELGWKDRPVGSGKMDTKAFLQYGYSPYLEEDKTDSSGAHFSASHTLEYSFSAYAAAQMAKALGKKADYEKLIRYSNGWKYLYNPANKLLQPKKADGTFIDHFDPYAPWRGYQEGNAMQYSFYVPQDPAALIATMGRDYFNDHLNDIFEKSEKDGFGGGKTINAFAGITSIYNHGNEPSLHISWLFNFSGKPWLTQRWTRAICDSFYGIEPIHGYGYGQDEDQGQLGAWYIMTALGLFDVKGFTDVRPIVELGSPLFAKADVELGDGKELVIETKNNSADNVFVQSVSFNGRPLDNCWIYRDELMKGGKLVFVMGGTPNKEWGVGTPPPSADGSVGFAGSAGDSFPTSPAASAYLQRAEAIYHEVWDHYRVPRYDLFSEYYPQQHTDSLGYMQGAPTASRPVSFLWPFSGVFSATNMLVQAAGKKTYLPFLDSVAEAMEKYRDTVRKPVGYQAYPAELERSDRYYDDNGLVALDYTWAYRNTGDARYLRRAEETFRFILSGWSASLGGGVTWLEGHEDQKPACSNGMATLAALKLYEVTKDPFYLKKGRAFYHWMQTHLLDSNGLYANDVKTKDGRLNHTYYTYNTGSMLESAVLLYQFTGERARLREAQALAAASLRYFGKPTGDGVLRIMDMPWFVLVLFRGYDALYRVDHDPKYVDVIKAEADHHLLGKHWDRAEPPAKAEWLLDASCLAEFYARLALLN